MSSTTNSSYYMHGPHGPHIVPQPAINIAESASSSVHSGVNSEINVEPNNANVEPNNANMEPNNANMEQPNNAHMEPIADDVKIDNENEKNNEHNNNGELLEDKKSLNSIIQYPALNNENLNNMIVHIDDLATKYDQTINILNDTLPAKGRLLTKRNSFSKKPINTGYYYSSGGQYIFWISPVTYLPYCFVKIYLFNLR